MGWPMSLSVEALEIRVVPSVPVTQAIELNPDRVVYVVSGLSFPSANQDLLLALNSWADVVPIHFRETDAPVDPATLPDPVIVVRDSATLPGEPGDADADAETPGPEPQVILVRAEDWSDLDLTRVLRHELGHTLGLLHETDPNTPSVMQPDVGDVADSPTPDDIVAVHRLYPAGSGDVSTFDGTPYDPPSAQAGVGEFDPTTATWYLRPTPTPGASESFRYGEPGREPVVGDWRGAGTDGVGVYDPATSTFYLRREADAGAPDAGVFRFGMPGDKPVIGDWDGTGFSKLGVFRPSTGDWYLAVEGGVKVINAYGAPDAAPLSIEYGGKDCPAVYDDAGVFHSPYGLSQEPPGYSPVVGDWFGQDVLAVVSPDAVWYGANPYIDAFAFGARGWIPLEWRCIVPSAQQPTGD